MRKQTKECVEILRNWDNDKLVSTIDMGGMGPGYEQAIHICAFEMLRYIIDNPIDFDKSDSDDGEEYWESYKKSRDASLYADGSPCKELGLTGAQAGAAGNVSSMFFRHGPKKAVSMADNDRHIMVCRTFP